MTVYNRLRYILAVLVVVGTLFSLTACKKTVEPAISDTVATTTGSEDTATTTDAAATEATTTVTTVATTKAPTTTTRTPNTTAKPVVNQTTKAPTTQTQTIKTQLNAMGQPEKVLTPEQICREQEWTAEQYKARLVKYAVYKCEYCNQHDCPSLVYLHDTNGDIYTVTKNKWKCAAYVASEPKCETCGKKLCYRNDAEHPESEYCMGRLAHAIVQ